MTQFFLCIQIETICRKETWSTSSVADQGRLSRIQIFPIPAPGSASKNLSILTQKIVSKLSEMCSGLFIPDPGVKKAPDPGSATLSTIQLAYRHRGDTYSKLDSIFGWWLQIRFEQGLIRNFTSDSRSIKQCCGSESGSASNWKVWSGSKWKAGSGSIFRWQAKM